MQREETPVQSHDDDKQEPKNPFTGIPDNLLVNVLSFLSPREVAQSRLVNRSFNRASTSPEFFNQFPEISRGSHIVAAEQKKPSLLHRFVHGTQGKSAGSIVNICQLANGNFITLHTGHDMQFWRPDGSWIKSLRIPGESRDALNPPLTLKAGHVAIIVPSYHRLPEAVGLFLNLFSPGTGWIAPSVNIYASDGALIQKFDGHQTEITCMVESSDEHIISGDTTGRILKWNRDGISQAYLPENNTRVTYLGICELHNRYILSWDKDGRIRIWHTNGTLLISEVMFIQSPAQTADIICGVNQLQNNTIICWNFNGAIIFRESDGALQSLRRLNCRVREIAPWCEDKIIISSDNGLQVCDPQSGRFLQTIDTGSSRVRKIIVVNRQVISWQHDGSVILYEEAEAGLLQQKDPARVRSQAMPFFDGRILAYAAAKSPQQLALARLEELMPNRTSIKRARTPR